LTSEYGTPLSPEQIDQRKREEIKTKYYVRLRPAYIPFFQAMAEDYYQRSKIKSPTIGLLAKTCLITAGYAWNRMQVQLMNQNLDKRRLQQEAGNPVNKLTTERGYPAFNLGLDTSSKAWKRPPQHQSQPRPKDQNYYDEGNGELE
jgi:hypothetical protein